LYDLDTGGDNWIKLNYRLNSGSGAGDMYAYIPESSFVGLSPDGYVYLYSKFGQNNAANAGFEEWAVRTGVSQAPPPPAPVPLSSLSGYVYLDLNNDGVRDANERGIAGVMIQLRGTNDLGQTVVMNAYTNDDGFYSFVDLRAGTYSLLETQPDNYIDGQDTIGTQGGLFENDRFFEIILAAGVDGRDNLFGEQEVPPEPT
jgi:hypothetical protein